MEANGAVWEILRDRQNAQGRRIDNVEEAIKVSAHQQLRTEEKNDERLQAVERGVAEIKAQNRLIGWAIIVGTPVFTAILVTVIK